ncbi:unnamed protein product [Brachionus calyciflorus]|uniref:Uncharacterized protein n=1 Tax=Brachionus calyciflorus TaxID=104777 RepID=A0A813MSN5_9BILA|nr:unnamed protein product [Brachionus calyciflorus]
MENEDSNTLIIQSNSDINENDLDLIVMFFESKKQSGGGDSIKNELIDKRLLKITYEDSQVKERILKKKYFSFKKYQFKSYDSNINGYLNDTYDLNPYCLVIKDIFTDTEFDPNNLDDSVIKMYAEHLSPDNDVIRITKSHLFDDTFYVTYKSELNMKQIETRYNKKPKLRNQEITIYDYLKTKSIVIASFSSSNSQVNNINKVSSKIAEEMENKGPFETNNYFMDLHDDYIVFQCENDTILNEISDSLKVYLRSLNNNLNIEEVHNFKLLKFIKPILKNQEKNVTPIKVPEMTKESGTQVYETKMAETKNESKIETVNEEQKTETVKIPREKVEKLKNKIKSPKATTSKNTENPVDDLNIEKVKMDDFYLNNLLKSQTDNEVILNEEAPLSIGLINCAQLRADLNKELETSNGQLYYNKKNKYKTLSVKFDKESKNKCINITKNFAKIHFLYKIVHLPSSISNDPVLMEALVNYVPNLNKQYPGIYLNVNGSSIHCYGYPKSLGKVLDTNCGLLKDLIEKRNLKNVESQKTEETKQVVRPKQQTTPEKQVITKAKCSGKPLDSKFSEKQSPSIKNLEKKEPLVEEKLENGEEWKQKVSKSKKEPPSFENPNHIILYSSYQPIDNIKLLDRETLKKPNFVLIDQKNFRVLSICILKCYQIAIDFMNDLKMISPICQLVYVKDKENNPQHGGILIESEDEKYIESYKIQMEKLLNYYENNRLKHVYNLIDDKLKMDEVFPTLISNFNSKNELNDLKIILEMIYNSDKVVHAQIVDKKLIEIYGYTNAVQNYDNYALEILNKTINYFNNNLNNLLAFKIFQKDVSKLSVFFKFDGYYFNDFVEQLTPYEAHVVKIDENKAIHLACFSKKLRNNPRKLEILNEIRNWRSEIEDFVNEYLEMFDIEQIKMPFSRNSELPKSILYDKNTLDIIWIDDDQLEIFGLKEEIEKFKSRIF